MSLNSLRGSLGEQHFKSSHPVGLIAGNGQLPLLFAKTLNQRGQKVIAVGHEGESDPELANLVDEFQWVRLGQFKKVLSFFSRHGVKWVVMVGGITKTKIWSARPDALALKIAFKLRHLHDDMLLRAVAAVLEERGFLLKSVTEFIPELLAPRGVLSVKRPSVEQWSDIQFGWLAAKKLGEMDIGQGVVVRQKIVAAVEAMEGTDAMIQRAGPLVSGKGWSGGGSGAVLVKVAKPIQDHRLDLPTIGPNTMRALHQAGISALAIEAGAAMILEIDVTCKLADKFNLVLVGCLEEDIPTPQWDMPVIKSTFQGLDHVN